MVSSFITKQKLAVWLKNNKDTDDVFVGLKLNAADDSILKNPKFVAWVKEAAKQTESTKDLATKLQTEQMETWKRAKLSTDSLFNMYKLDSEAKDLLASPGLRIWVRYAEEFNPGPKTTLFEKLHASYSDFALSQLLLLSKKAPSTEKLATSLQREQLQTWLNSGKQPQTVFKVLRLDSEADNLFASPQFKIWLDYSLDFRKKFPRANTVPVIDTLVAHYGDAALSRIIKAAKEGAGTKTWAVYYEQALVGKLLKAEKTPAYISRLVGRQVTPDDAFQLLKSDMGMDNILRLRRDAFKFFALDKAGGNLFTHSGYDTWLTYAKAFKNENPNAKKDPVIDTLTTSLGDHALVELIKRTEKTPATKENAAYIKNALLDEWVKTNKSPANGKMMNAPTEQHPLKSSVYQHGLLPSLSRPRQLHLQRQRGTTFLAFVGFGLASWIMTNVTYVELGVFLRELPEHYSIYAYSILALESANLYPLLYMLLNAKQQLLSQSTVIWWILLQGVVVSFSVSTFYLICATIMCVSLVAFAFLQYHPWAHEAKTSEELTAAVNGAIQSSQQAPDRGSICDEREAEEDALLTRNACGSCPRSTSASTVTIPSQTATQCSEATSGAGAFRQVWQLLACQWVLAAFSFGWLPSTMPFVYKKFAPPENAAIATARFQTTASIAALILSPLASVSTTWFQLYYVRSMTLLLVLLASLLMTFSLTSRPVFSNYDDGYLLPLLVHIFYLVGCAYTQTMLYLTLKRTADVKQLPDFARRVYQWNGLATQLGAMSGTAVAFPLVFCQYI
ncbi:hypothetical protein PInf_008216 [Phytophthora infestans]|nr:hypothetical protein PInf_008216 [Phytophthora infestans]